jgi:cation transport ATPase
VLGARRSDPTPNTQHPTPDADRPCPVSTAAAIWNLARRYPIAACALLGLTIGLALLPFDPHAARSVFAAVAVGGGIPLAWSNLQNMLRGRFHVDAIATLAVIGSIALGEFLAGALVVLMQSGGEALEDYGLRRAHRSLDNLLRRAPSVARRLRGGEFVDVPAAEIRVGDTLLVRPGDIIAADGVVIDGQGSPSRFTNCRETRFSAAPSISPAISESEPAIPRRKASMS